MARLVRGFLDAGLPEDGLLEVTRVIGLSMSQVARAVSQLTAQTVLSDAESERDVAIRLAEAAKALTPMASEIFDHAFRVHQLEVLRSEVVGSEQIATGKLAGSQEYTIAFADLVGFTKLGEKLDPDEYGAVTERLARARRRHRRAARAPGQADRRRGDARLARERAGDQRGARPPGRRGGGGGPARAADRRRPRARRWPAPATSTAAPSTSPAA